MSTVELLPAIAHRLAAVSPRIPLVPLNIPRSVTRIVGRVRWIRSADAAWEVTSCLLQQSVAWVGLDTEFLSSSKPSESTLRTVQLSPVVHRDSALEVWRGLVFDANCKSLLEPLAKLLRQPWRFVVHYAEAEMQSLRAHDLPIPRDLFDTHLAARLCTLGRRDWQDFLEPEADIVDAPEVIRARHCLREAEDKDLSLLGLCKRFNVVHSFSGRKKQMATRFGSGEAVTSEMVAYAAQDAQVAAELYLPMVQQLESQGLRRHFEQIELPALPVVSDISRQGITVDPSRLKRVHRAAAKATDLYADELREQAATLGVRFENPRSGPAATRSGARPRS